MKVRSLAAMLVLICFQVGCTGIGVVGIVAERQEYNEAVNYTSAQQTLINLVRVYNRENPTFLSVADITSNKSISASLNGGSSNLGALLPIGALTSMVSVNEQPVVKYSTTTGFELIRQISTPISINSIFQLSSSNAPMLPLLILTLNRFTPEFGDYFRAITMLNSLDTLGAITIQQVGLDVVSVRYNPSGMVSRPVAGNAEDALILCYRAESYATLARHLWSQLTAIFKQGNSKEILLITSPTKSRETYILPRSAQGALSVSGNDHDIAFLPSEEIDRVINENRHQGSCLQDFYFLGRDELSAPDAWQIYYKSILSTASASMIQYDFRRVASQRALILVQTSSAPLSNAFVSYERRGVWYSIRDDDVISKRNFSLLSTITIIQALPAAPPTPTVTSIQLRN
ncbi:hypothetical protein AIGOOFII_4056 [Methylobacterium marchantiae]|nr:hypothetical protein AIGOOFII_4056 [Methylobacterium marchantiae]